jgi:CII-binding regulator of phage lambda lysogenization HflD
MGSRPFGEYANQILTGMEKIASVVQASMRTLEPSLERLTRAILVANERLLAIDWDKGSQHFSGHSLSDTN